MLRFWILALFFILNYHRIVIPVCFGIFFGPHIVYFTFQQSIPLTDLTCILRWLY